VETVARSLSARSVLLAPTEDGLIATELFARGYDVACTELAPDVELEVKSRHGEEAALELVNEGRGSLPYVDLKGRIFELVATLWGSLGWLDKSYDTEFLEAANQALMPGGRLLIDTQVLETLAKHSVAGEWEYTGRYLALIKRRYLPAAGILHVDSSLLALDEANRVTLGSQTCHDVYIYRFNELLFALSEAGFQVESAFDSMDGSGFGIGSRRLALVARKVA
jgi:hypothetical protein